LLLTLQFVRLGHEIDRDFLKSVRRRQVRTCARETRARLRGFPKVLDHIHHHACRPDCKFIGSSRKRRAAKKLAIWGQKLALQRQCAADLAG